MAVLPNILLPMLRLFQQGNLKSVANEEHRGFFFFSLASYLVGSSLASLLEIGQRGSDEI